MGFVRTILKDIAPERLGVTYAHEHLVCVPPYWRELGETDFWLGDVEKSFEEVMLFKQAGGNAIIDATVVDYGHRAKDVGDIARRSGVHIVASTGFNKGILWPAKIPGKEITYEQWINQSTTHALCDHFVKEIEEGMDGTSLRAGQIKYGTGYNCITALDRKTIEAAVLAHRVTKAPLHVHLERGTMPLEQIEILKSLHFDMRNISFGHLNLNPDPFLHQKVARAGAYVCFDGVGKVKYHPDSLIINLIFQLVEAGFQRQILVSGDTARRSYFRTYSQARGLPFILESWRPRLIEEANTRGIDGMRLSEDLFINNPKECFAFKL